MAKGPLGDVAYGTFEVRGLVGAFLAVCQSEQLQSEVVLLVGLVVCRVMVSGLKLHHIPTLFKFQPMQ